MAATSVKETKVYKLAFTQAMEIFEISKKFPKEETYSLTDQIRRSSRSVTITIAEAYRKREYPKYFHSKCGFWDTVILLFTTIRYIIQNKIIMHN